MHVEIAPKVVSSNPVSRRSGPKTCAPTMRGAARGHMCSRVLEARKWSGPGRVGAGCDARVLGLHAAHVGGVQEGSAVPRSGQRGRDVGRLHLVFNIRLASRMPSSQRYTSCMVPLRRSQRVRTDRANIRLLTPRKSPARTYKVCTALSAPERHMCSRVLGDREWSRPDRVSARHTSAITLPGAGMCMHHFRA